MLEKEYNYVHSMYLSSISDPMLPCNGIQTNELMVSDGNNGIQTNELMVSDGNNGIQTNEYMVSDGNNGIQNNDLMVSNGNHGIQTNELMVSNGKNGIQTNELIVSNGNNANATNGKHIGFSSTAWFPCDNWNKLQGCQCHYIWPIFWMSSIISDIHAA